MFFGLFGITNRLSLSIRLRVWKLIIQASSLIGPNICAAIIDNTGNQWNAFIFLYASSAFLKAHPDAQIRSLYLRCAGHLDLRQYGEGSCSSYRLLDSGTWYDF